MYETITGQTPIAELVRQYWLFQLSQISRQEDILLGRSDPAGPGPLVPPGTVPAGSAAADPRVAAVHDLRVAVRRCQSSAEACAPYLSRHWPDRINETLRTLRKGSNRLRDLDVLLDWLAARQPTDPAAAAWLAALHRERQHQLTDLTETLTDKQQHQALARLAKRLTRPDALDSLALPPVSKTGQCHAYRMQDVAPAILLTKAAAITVYHTVLPSPESLPVVIRQAAQADPDLLRAVTEPADRPLHHLRVAGKDFRYALEMLAPGLDPSAQTLLQTFRGFQDILGQLHDRIQAISLFQDRQRAGDRRLPAVAPLLNALQTERQGLEQKFQAVWPQMTQSWFVREIGAILAPEKSQA
jgi:CHAD domain-containing protein